MKRRDMLKQGAAALAGAASASAMSAGAVAAQQPAGAGAASQTRRRFRAYIRMATGAAVREVQMLPLRDNMVAIRTEATQCCYTIVNQALGTGPAGGAGGAVAARILGHGGVGVVEAVGTQVTRVQPGDRVLVTNTPHCGECYSCLRRRGDICQMNPSAGEPLVPIGELEDGTPVHQHNNTGGFAELMITYDWYCVPAFTKASAAELAVLGCVGATGLGAVTTFVPVDFGESVVVMGAGPIGLSAVQGARIMGASPIICVEPIAVRRELALKMGATHVLDPNVEGDGLVRKVRDLVSAANPRKFLGGRDTNPDSDSRGADYVVATVGADVVPPSGLGDDAGRREPDYAGVAAGQHQPACRNLVQSGSSSPRRAVWWRECEIGCSALREAGGSGTLRRQVARHRHLSARADSRGVRGGGQPHHDLCGRGVRLRVRLVGAVVRFKEAV
jgi:S-(hydroxymethyl)glutathione dehydrogenase/alcohol dehydrogenase